MPKLKKHISMNKLMPKRKWRMSKMRRRGRRLRKKQRRVRTMRMLMAWSLMLKPVLPPTPGQAPAPPWFPSCSPLKRTPLSWSSQPAAQPGSQVDMLIKLKWLLVLRTMYSSVLVTWRWRRSSELNLCVKWPPFWRILLWPLLPCLTRTRSSWEPAGMSVWRNW